MQTLRRDQTNLLDGSFDGRQLDLELIVQPSDHQPLRLSVLEGADAETVIGYDPMTPQR